jgi:hypothetical protein
MEGLVDDLSYYLNRKEDMNTIIDRLDDISSYNHQSMETNMNELINNTSIIEELRKDKA